MDILGKLRKVPGGLMIIPMLITAVINTFFPQVLQIGGLTTSLFTAKGTLTVIGILMFLIGSQFRVSEIAMTMKRGGVICLAKLLIGFIASWVVLRFFGLDGFWGMSSLAVCVTIISTNPGVYIALVDHYGDGIG